MGTLCISKTPVVIMASYYRSISFLSLCRRVCPWFSPSLITFPSCMNRHGRQSVWKPQVLSPSPKNTAPLFHFSREKSEWHPELRSDAAEKWKKKDEQDKEIQREQVVEASCKSGGEARWERTMMRQVYLICLFLILELFYTKKTFLLKKWVNVFLLGQN